MSVALITNCIPPYRVPLFERLAAKLGVELFLWDAGAADAAGIDPTSLSFPVTVLDNQRAAYAVAKSHDATICGLGGRIALPAAYVGARRAKRPFVLWASIWSHPRSPVHLASTLPTRAIYRNADAVVTYGPHVSAYVRRHRTAEGVFEAPQSVEAELFERPVSDAERQQFRAQHNLGDGPIVLFVGRLIEEKGIRTLAQAWRELPIAAHAKLLVVGQGTFASALQGPGIEHAGRIARTDLPTAYSCADMLVLPSIQTLTFTEPWGLVVNEAMHQATPVVTSNAVGAAAGGLVRDRENGLVVPAADSTALAAAITTLLEDAELRTRLGEQGKRDVAAHNYDAMVAGFGQALEFAIKTPISAP